MDLERCPFCGGKAKISKRRVAQMRRDYPSYTVKRKTRLQVICNRCHARGKPFTTDWLLYDAINNPQVIVEQMLNPWKEKAVEAWNRRTDK